MIYPNALPGMIFPPFTEGGSREARGWLWRLKTICSGTGLPPIWRWTRTMARSAREPLKRTTFWPRTAANTSSRDRLSPDHPTVAGNEWIAARLADGLGLPVLDYRIASMEGALFFASSWMPGPSFSPALDESLFRRCSNRDRAYAIVVFDAWLANYDRHNELVARRKRDSGEHLLLLNDHSHLLIGPGGPQTSEHLLARLDDPPGAYVKLDFLRASIAEAGRLGQALGTVETLDERFVREVVRSTPDEFLPQDNRNAYEEFLTQRRSRLRQLFSNDKESFPNLDGAV